MTTVNDADVGTEWSDDDNAPAAPGDNQPAADAAEPAPAADPTPDTDDNGRNDGFQRRIDELTRRRREAETALAEQTRAREDLERRLQELQRPQPTTPATEGQPQPAPRTYSEAELQAEARRLAQEEARTIAAQDTARRQQDAYIAQCNKVHAAGVAAFGETAFNTGLQDLARMGVSADQTPELFNEMFEMENPAALINHYAKNPNAALDLQNMTPLQRGATFARLSIQLAAAPAPPPLSKVPAPITPINGDRGRDNVDLYSDDIDDAAWFAERNRQRNAR